ncbi:NmrA/HSCARG family protein [Nocardia sp. 2]|uniref:NmrA/HSCARG family protein n=1 Tax=Nocardia acididurans TaxID=2802282 RepID=A0ABS1MFS8_9NOCA|nr:NmrA/HSCARG family protein [Nocardia acididurans]MBL1079114.1 NmrA/HSCARG family protein [Nocardia acididurans]
MSSRNETILVTGATGQQGGATARALLAAGRSVRALVRDPESAGARELAGAGAELVVGDFDDGASIDAAVAGVRGVFAVPPATYSPAGWDIELEATRGENLVSAAEKAGVDHFVFTGVAQFEDQSRFTGFNGKQRIEAAVTASGMRWTVLRPVRFMENYLVRGAALDGIRPGGLHVHAFPADRPIQVIAVADIADIAVLAFADPDRFHGLTLDLAGDARTFPAAAEAISAAIGLPVRYEPVSEADADALGPEIGNVWRQSRVGRGWNADIAAVREIHPGLRTLDDWLAESGAARLKSMLAG